MSTNKWPLTLTALVASMMMLTRPVRAAFPGANGEIAYAKAIPGASPIWLINPDGTNPRLIIQEPGGDNFQPAWSPDGKRLVFTHGNCCNWAIWIANADGTMARQLTNESGLYSDGTASWSADGTEIVFHHITTTSSNIFVMKADGSDLRQLTNSPANDDWPVWSPTANRIAFERNRDGHSQIYVMNTDGTNVVRLTFEGTNEIPEWSPDGTKIVFDSDRDGNNEIYIMNADGSNQVRLTKDSANDRYPQWSPDGTMIAFTREPGSHGVGLIFTMKTDGSNQRQLTTQLVGQNAAWRPIHGWKSTGSMKVPRTFFTMTRLFDGRVLAVGGTSTLDVPNSALASAELYNPATGKWSLTGAMHVPRRSHSATLLPDGRVLVAGGQNTNGAPALASAEIYNPVTGAWKRTGDMLGPRVAHFAALVNVDGSSMVLVTAGSDVCHGCTPIATAELFNPATGRWSPTGSLAVARSFPPGATLPDGKVMIVGGITCCAYSEANDAEIYDPATGIWRPTGPKATRAVGGAALMADGKVIVASGWTGTQPNNQPVKDAELFDPSPDPALHGWIETNSMLVARQDDFTITLLRTGEILVAGGNNGGWGVCNPLSEAELYRPSIGSWQSAGSMAFKRLNFSAVRLMNGAVLVAGGQTCLGNVVWSSAELYQP